MLGVDVVGHGPGGELVPLVKRAAVNGEPQLEVDILGVIQLNKHLLHNVGKVFSVDKVVCLHKDLSQSRLTNWVVFCIELVKSVKCVSVLLKRKYDETKYCDMNEMSYRVTIQHVDGEVIRGEIHGLEDLVEGHDLVVDLAHSHLGVRLDALFDEPEEMLLVHAGCAVDVGVHLPHVVEVSMRNRLLLRKLPDLIEEDVELVFGLEILQTLETEALKRTISDHSTQKLEICHKLLQSDSLKYFRQY